jgi:N-acyl-D-amino-acid deacylase
MRFVRASLVVTCIAVFGVGLQLKGEEGTLLDAIRANDGKRVQTLLAEGADPNSKDVNQASALMYAALYASPRVLDQLIRGGADLTYRDKSGLTALAWAVHSYESAKVLIDAGADVNAKSNIGGTPLLTAAAYPGNAPLLRLMLERGAELQTSVFGATALILAALTGDADSIALLLKKGSDPNAPGPGGFSALHFAVMRGDRRMVQLLIDAGVNVKIRTSKEEDALERYGFWNDPALVRMLLERGIDPARKDARGHNALLFAASSDTVTPEVFALLLKNTPSVNARTAYGDDALQAAQRRADARIAELLGGSAPVIEPPKARAIVFRPPQIQASISLSLELLAKNGPSVVNQRGCFSCHHQGLPSLAEWYARRAGIDAVQIAETNRKLVHSVLQGSAQLMQHGAAPAGEAATVAWQLIGLASDGQPADLVTDLAVNYLAATQMPDGSWPERWGRPPLEYSPVSATAVAIRALDLYGFSSRRQEFNERIGRAGAWLAKTRPAASEESAMRLLGLVWSRAPRAVIVTAARELASAQRRNGGWAQLPALPADAYATGQALVALRESGLFKPESPGFHRGAKYLLGTQEPDGSWHVRGRSLPVQLLFESGFPHGRDQWISAAGTSWAAMALALALR